MGDDIDKEEELPSPLPDKKNKKANVDHKKQMLILQF